MVQLLIVTVSSEAKAAAHHDGVTVATMLATLHLASVVPGWAKENVSGTTLRCYPIDVTTLS